MVRGPTSIANEGPVTSMVIGQYGAPTGEGARDLTKETMVDGGDPSE